MTRPDRTGTRNQYMVHGRVNRCIAILPLLEDDPRRHKARLRHDVDLVKGQPIIDQSPIALEHGTRISIEQVDQPAIAPSAIRIDEMHGDIIVVERHQRLNAMRAARPKNILVKGKAFFIGLGFVSFGKNAAPGDR